jgi:hypothetical protein
MQAMNRPRQPIEELHCELAAAVGLAESCPGAPCAFWEGTEGCALGGLRPEFGKNPELARLLHGLRAQLGHAVRPLPVALPGMDA